MIKYPIEFQAITECIHGMESTWKTTCNNGESAVSIPPEFMGPGGALSPEDLYNHALTNCFVATFKVFAQNSRLTFEKIEIESKLNVDLDENKRPVMKDFYLNAKIKAPSNSEKALLLAKKAADNGFILNSVKTKCHFNFEVT